MTAARARFEDVGDVASFRSSFAGRSVRVRHVEDDEGAEWVDITLPDGSRLTLEGSPGDGRSFVARLCRRLERRGGEAV